MVSSTFTPSTFLNHRRFLLTTLDDNSRTSPSTASAASSVWSCDGSRHAVHVYGMNSSFQNSNSRCFRRSCLSSCNSSRRRISSDIYQSGGFEHLSAIAAATSLAFLLTSTPVQAGVLSGSSGLEAVPLPEFQGFDFLKRMQEENKKKNEAYDGKFKSSPLLQELLKRSKANSERNKQEIQDKYCERGAEWGVGDCSTTGMSRDEREAFMEMLRKKRAPK